MGPEGLTGRNGSVVLPGKKGSIGHPGVQGFPGHPGLDDLEIQESKDYQDLNEIESKDY